MEINNKLRKILKPDLLIISFIIVFTLFISLLKFSKGYTFEWDQSDDAAKVFSIIQQQKPLLIGPRVASDNGFFIGPYHYYYLLPFFFITKGDPVAGVYAVIFINILTTIISFLLIKKIFNKKIAFLATIITAICLGKICWNVMYAPLIAIIAFYICYQAINKRFSFPLAMLFSGFIANIHLVPASLFPIILISFLLAKEKPKTKEIFLGILFFLIPFLPLFVFDIRHNFLNLNKLFLMIFGAKENIAFSYIWLRSFWRSLNIIGIFPVLIERLFFLSVLLISPFLIKGNKNKVLIIIWALLPLLLLSRYKGTVSEYYYGMVTSIMPLLLSYIFFQFKNIKTILLILFLICFSVFRLTKLNNALVTLNDKKAIVLYLINQKQDQPFNLSYETGIGFDFGFDYLFTYYGNRPQNSNNAHLYTLFLKSNIPEKSNIIFEKSIYSLIRR